MATTDHPRYRRHVPAQAARPLSRFQRASIAALVAAMSASQFACTDASPPPPPAASSAVLAAVPEPEHVGATLVLKDGGATWERMRAALGGDGALLPSRLGTYVASAVGLPIGCAESVSDHEPIVGAMLDPSLLHPFEAAIAVHLRSADSVLAAATQGPSAPFRAEHDARAKGDLLKRVGSGPDVALGLFGNHLVIGTSVDALLALGPYLARTAANALPPNVPEGTLGLLDVRADTLSVALPILRTRATVADGPTGAFVNPLIAELFHRAEDATHVTATVTADDATATVTIRAERTARTAPGRTVPVAALLDLPRTVDVGVVDAHDASSAAVTGAPFGAIANFLAPKERADAELAGNALASARGPKALLGFENGPVGPVVYARADWVDVDKGRAALTDLVAIANRDATRTALAGHGVYFDGKHTVIANVGSVFRFRVGADEDDPRLRQKVPNTARNVDVLFRDADATLDVASGTEAVTALEALSTGDHLGGLEAIAALARRLPKEAHAALFLDPSRLIHGARSDHSHAFVVEADEPTAVTFTCVLAQQAMGAVLQALLR